jgi:hypothetical protein
MRSSRCVVATLIFLFSFCVSAKEPSYLNEFTSYQPYYDCLDMIESNSFMTESTCEVIKQGIDLNRKEVDIMRGLCGKSDATYYSDGRPIYAIKNGRVFSSRGLVHDCDSGGFLVLDSSPFE